MDGQSLQSPTRSRWWRGGALAATLAAWWFGYRALVPWVQRTVGADRITDPDAKVVLGHWVFWQLPAVLLCLAVWAAGARLSLLPTIRSTLTSGGSWRRVVVS